VPSGVFIHTDGEDGARVLVNNGTLAAPDFVAFGTQSLLDAESAVQAGKFLVSGGATFTGVAMQGDATLASTGAVTITQKLNQAIPLSNWASLIDGVTGGVIPVTTSGYLAGCANTATNSKTATLAPPLFVNQIITLTAQTMANAKTLAITCETLFDGTNDVATFSTAGQTLVLIGLPNGTDLRWRILANIGTVVMS
jgi:hypothetical protein